MGITIKSIFDAPLMAGYMACGIDYGRGWHAPEDVRWSRDAICSLSFGVDLVPARYVAELQVFAASRANPKTLWIDSTGQKQIKRTITTDGVCVVVIESPVLTSKTVSAEIQFRLDTLDSPAWLGLSVDERQLGLRILSIQRIVDGMLFPLACSSPEICREILIEGWSLPDPTAIWSVGNHSRVILPGFIRQETKTLVFDFDTLPYPAEATPLVITVEHEGVSLAEWVRVPGAQGLFRCPVSDVWQVDEPLALDLRFTNTLSPEDIGLNCDPRHLGIFLRSISAEE